MKIECVKEKLAWSVGRCERITGKNVTLPVLKCILLEVKNNMLTLRATNLDLGIKIDLPVKVEEGGTVAVPGNILQSFVQHVSGNKSIKLETLENNLKVWTEHNSTLIKSLPHEDFPSIPLPAKEKTFKIQSKDIVNGLKSVWYSSATSSMKPELSSVFIHEEGDSIVFAATDSFRLGEKRIPIKKSADFTQILIPYKNTIEIVRILEEIDDEIEVNLSPNQISFSHKDLYLTSRIIDGSFPDYKQIIPKEYKTEAVVLKQDLLNALKLATIFSDSFNQINFKLKPKDKKFEISTRNADVGENINVIDGALSGEDLEVNFNYKYVADCFQSINSDSISLQFNGAAKPMIIRGVGDKSYLYLVMPMNR